MDKATEQPIIGAIITYADNEKLKSPQRIVTNMDGEATISVPQSDKCYYQVVLLQQKKRRELSIY